MDIFAQIQSAAHDGAFGNGGLPEPSLANLRAGNYKKGRVKLHGLPIAIETPQGTRRTGKSDGKPWSVICMAHYGYIEKTKGADGDALDVFIGPWPESERVVVINRESSPSTFDEHKLLLGFPTYDAAISAYTNSYEKGQAGIGSAVVCTIDQLKWWIAYGNHAIPLELKHLPFDGDSMNDVNWDQHSNPIETTVPQLLYALRRDDASAHALLDAVTVESILEDSDGEIVLDALVLPLNRLERKLNQMQIIMRAAGDKVKPIGMQITDPFKQRGTTNVAAIFEMSDGQTISVYFHNPDSTPNRLTPDDEMVSWKWLLNKRDITIVVAKERGKDMNPREVARRVMKLVDANSERFQNANAKKAERMAAIEAGKAEISSKEQLLEGLKAEITDLEAKVEAKRNRKPATLQGNETGTNATKDDQPAVVQGNNPSAFNKVEAIVLEWSEGSGDENREFGDVAALQKWFVDTFEYGELTSMAGYRKNKLHITVSSAEGATATITERVDVSLNEGDFNPYRETIADYLRENGYNGVHPRRLDDGVSAPVEIPRGGEVGKATEQSAAPNPALATLIKDYEFTKVSDYAVESDYYTRYTIRAYVDKGYLVLTSSVSELYRVPIGDDPVAAADDVVDWIKDFRQEKSQKTLNALADNYGYTIRGAFSARKTLDDGRMVVASFAAGFDKLQLEFGATRTDAVTMSDHSAGADAARAFVEFVEAWAKPAPAQDNGVSALVVKDIIGTNVFKIGSVRYTKQHGRYISGKGESLKVGDVLKELRGSPIEVDSNDDLKRAGKVKITDVGSENVYFEYGYLPYFTKLLNPDNYASRIGETVDLGAQDAGEQDAFIAAAVEAAKNKEIVRLRNQTYFTFDFEGDEVIVNDKIIAKVEAVIGEKLVETELNGGGHIALVPASQAASPASPAIDYLRQVIAGEVDLGSPELADKLEALYHENGTNGGKQRV